MLLALVITDREKSAIEFIYDEHSKKMLYTAGKILGDNLAQEAVHDVFVKTIERNEFGNLRDKPGTLSRRKLWTRASLQHP